MNNAIEENNIDTQAEAIQNQDPLDLILLKLEQLWGEDLDKNLLLSQRGLEWLGFDEQTLAEDYSEIIFLNKMVDLGKLLSEDEMVAGNAADFNMSAGEAKKLRSKMTAQKDILDALHNKGDMRHKEVLNYINRLNEIISKEQQ
ncbi:MAG: hypothetical protein LBQ34_07055 [Alphaproteobacteria bacterium]|jgi:hypothetical protein|nr:hypothetical protein [Alphaproteobacteria bacterium]